MTVRLSFRAIGALATLAVVGGIAAIATSVPMSSEPAAVAASVPVPALLADAAHPAVVELYESQGCSSCPPANANVNELAGRSDILALNFAVTYWDQLGWKDTFAKPAYTARQWDYAHAAGRPQVATPQVIVNGRGTTVGSNPQALAAAIRQNDRGTGGPAIAANGSRVVVGAAPSAHAATVWLVRYDPRNLVVPIRAGENGGRSIGHRNIVRSLEQIGTWSGRQAAFALPANPDANYRAAILVQDGTGGKIVAASRI